MRRTWRDAAAALALAALTGGLLLHALLYLRESALRSGTQLADSLSRVIAEQTERALQSVDQRLQLAILRIDSLRDARLLDEHSGRAALRADLKGLPFLRALWVLDTDGRIVLDSDEGKLGSAMGGRPYFQAFARKPETEFFIGPALRSHATGTWMLSVARPMRGPDGSVRAVLAGAVEPPYFEQLWRGIDLGANGAVALYRRNGQLVARSPADASLLGGDDSRLPLFAQHLPQSRERTFIRESGVDGVLRVVAYRQLPSYPDLVVAVGSSHDEMLAPWRRFAVLAAGVWLGAVLLAFALALQVRRHARNREESEQRLRQLTDAMPQIAFAADRQGGVTFVGRRWTEVTGRPADEALGTRWQQLVHPADRELMRTRLAEGPRSGEQVEHEYRLLCHDGSYRWQLLRAVPVPGPAGAGSWIGTATDVDDLKQAQDRLRAQAEELHMAGRLTRMGHWRADLATQRVALSPEAAAVLDLPPDVEPTLQAIFAMVVPHKLTRVVQAVNACICTGDPLDMEMELITGTGRHVWLRSVAEAVRDEAGRTVAIQGAQQDITLRVLMMEEIRRLNASLEERIAERTAQLTRQEALFRTLAEQAPLPFWTVDPAGRVTFLSQAWYELAGGAPPKWHGYEWTLAVHPDDLPQMEQQWRRCAPTGETFAGTRRIRARDSSYHTTTYRAVPVRDAGGEILFWVGVDTDITDLVVNEEALRLANTQLEAFSYSVSHDLQSPLQRVGSYARLLQQELQVLPEGRAHHYLARIQGNAEEMVHLIEGLLALAQVSEVDVIRAVVNVSELATGILQRLQAEQPQRRVAWQVEPGLMVMGDTRLMRSVLENLIGNAWKFSSRQPQARIEVGGLRQRGEYYVRDNGCGFDMAYADRLFGTFQRLHGPDEFPGTGIGLATVARAIVRQGGRVWAQSTPGEGATFFFTLPPAESAA